MGASALFMKKEVLVAIIVGGLVGIAIAFGIWKANSALSEQKGKPQETTETSIPSPQSLILSITSFENDSVVASPRANLVGITKSAALLAVVGEDDETVAYADESGNFEADIELVAGLNDIKISAFEEDGTSIEKILTLVYSTEIKTPTPVPTTSVSDQIRQRINQALSKPFASIGTIADISNSTLQIKTREGEINQAIVDKENTTFARVTGKTRKAIAFGDLAIGDFVLALGYRKSESIIEALRVIASDNLSQNKRTAIFGTATEIDSKKDQFTLKKLENSGDELAVTTDKNTAIRTSGESGLERAAFDDIEDGQKVIVVGEEDSKGNFLATFIYLLPSP